ncbi:MAG: deoxyhypusine synthase [Crenarchaeota archaeon]|nr:deoxyhypusine synthase [Thermoproteota archaeon]
MYRIGRPSCEIGSIEELIEAYKECGGYVARNMYDAAQILLEMFRDSDVTVMMSFTANLVATGLRSMIAEFVRRGFVDVIITTAGTLDHDIARACGGEYISYTFDVDDIYLRDEGYHRIGNIIVKVEHYGPIIEKFVHNLLDKIVNEEKITSIGVRELLYRAGKHIDDESSILRACYDAKVPIYVPGFVDGAFGTAILTFNEMQRSRGGPRVVVDVLLDERELMDIVYESRKLAGIIVGGGISKHHLIWWSQFKDGLDYAIYITTAVEWDGSLSGARPREAITWHKIKPTARTSFIYADATVVLPILFSYVVTKLKNRARRTLECLKWSH